MNPIPRTTNPPALVQGDSLVLGISPARHGMRVASRSSACQQGVPRSLCVRLVGRVLILNHSPNRPLSRELRNEDSPPDGLFLFGVILNQNSLHQFLLHA